MTELKHYIISLNPLSTKPCHSVSFVDIKGRNKCHILPGFFSYLHVGNGLFKLTLILFGDIFYLPLFLCQHLKIGGKHLASEAIPNSGLRKMLMSSSVEQRVMLPVAILLSIC